MPLLTAPTFVFAPGDTWPMPVTYRNPNNADGTLGAPINLTGATCSGVLFTRANLFGVPLVAVVDPLNGLMTFTVAEGVSQNFVADVIPPFADFYNFPTRLQVRVRDTLGNIETIAVFPIQVFDPRTVDVSTIPTGQAGTVVAGLLTPAQAAAMIAVALAPLQAEIAALQTPASVSASPS